MEPTILANDPYQSPFEWSDVLEPEAPEYRLFGLLLCLYQCELGWLPLFNGEFIACPGCQPESQ